MIFTRKRVFLILVLFIVARLGVSLWLEHNTSQTIDELTKLVSAQKTLHPEIASMYPEWYAPLGSDTQITLINAWAGAHLVELFPNVNSLFLHRLPSIVINQGLTPLAYILAHSLGATSAISLLFTFCVAFEPNLLGHSVIINVDVSCAVFFMIVAILGIRWTRRPSTINSILWGLSIGLSLSTKFSSAYAIPICFLWLCIASISSPKIGIRNGIAFLASIWFGINLIYGWNGFGIPIGNISFYSSLFTSLQSHLTSWPSLFPVSFLVHLDRTYWQDQTWNHLVYIRGNGYTHSIGYYFAYCLLLKTPLPCFITSLIGWGILIKTRYRDKVVQFIVLTFLIYLAYFSFMLRTQFGFRFILLLYPLFLLGMTAFPWKKRYLIIALVWFLASNAYNWPNFIGYFNEILIQKESRWWHLNDSNLAWKQETEDWNKEREEKHISKDQLNPLLFPIDRQFYVNAASFLPLDFFNGNPNGNQFASDHFDHLGSFRGVWPSFRLPKERIPEIFPPLIIATSPSSAPFPKRCEFEGFQVGNFLTHLNQITELNYLPKGRSTLSSMFYLPEESDVLFQVFTSEAIQVHVDSSSLGFTVYQKQMTVKRVREWEGRAAHLQRGMHSIAIDVDTTKTPEDYPDRLILFRGDVFRTQNHFNIRNISFCSHWNP